jgi:hypothetical protein
LEKFLVFLFHTVLKRIKKIVWIDVSILWLGLVSQEMNHPGQIIAVLAPIAGTMPKPITRAQRIAISAGGFTIRQNNNLRAVFPLHGFYKLVQEVFGAFHGATTSFRGKGFLLYDGNVLMGRSETALGDSVSVFIKHRQRG